MLISHIRPLLEFGSCVWNLEYISDMKLLKNVQRRWTKRINGFENLTYSQRLKDLDLFSVDGRLLRTDVIKCWKMCWDDGQKELMVLKILHILEEWKIFICFWLREVCWELTSSNEGKYSTVNVGYVRRLYLFQLSAVLLVAIALKSIMNVFH